MLQVSWHKYNENRLLLTKYTVKSVQDIQLFVLSHVDVFIKFDLIGFWLCLVSSQTCLLHCVFLMDENLHQVKLMRNFYFFGDFLFLFPLWLICFFGCHFDKWKERKLQIFKNRKSKVYVTFSVVNFLKLFKFNVCFFFYFFIF